MSERTLGRNLICASTAIKVLTGCLTARDMSEHTLVRNLISAKTVTSALTNYQLAKYMNEHTLVRNLISASIVISALAAHQIARHMNKHTEVQWSVRVEPLSKVSAAARDESAVSAGERFLHLHSFCLADSSPKAPLEPLRRRETLYHLVTIVWYHLRDELILNKFRLLP